MGHQPKIRVTGLANQRCLVFENEDLLPCKGSMLPNCHKCLGPLVIETRKVRLDPRFVVPGIRAHRRLKGVISSIMARCSSIPFVGGLAGSII